MPRGWLRSGPPSFPPPGKNISKAPADRLREQDASKISAEVLYPLFTPYLFDHKNAELKAACFRVFNDWAAEYCSHDPKRLIGLGVITLEEVQAAVAELIRIAKLGLRGVLLSGRSPENRPYSLPEYDPFWAAAQDLRVPISFYEAAGQGVTPPNRYEVLLNDIKRLQGSQLTLADIIMGGVLERFPQLNLVFAKNDISWLADLLSQLDQAYDRLRNLEGPSLSMRPSEYMKRNVMVTLHPEKTSIDIKTFGAEHVMWSSDYPRTNLPRSYSQGDIESIFQGIPAEDIRKITYTNMLNLYGSIDL